MSTRDRNIDKGGRLRMDRNPQPSRINDPSLPAGRRKEIDNVMKKARRDPNSVYWDKKLLEVEERDPNRWTHSGYKQLYIEEESRSVTRSRSITPTKRPVQRPDPRYHSPPKRPHSPSRRRAIEPRSPLPKSRSNFSKRPPSPPSPHISKRKMSSSSSSSTDSDYRSPIPHRHRAIRTPPYEEREHRKPSHVEKHVYEKAHHERPVRSMKHVLPSSSVQHRSRGSPKPRVTSTSDDIAPPKAKTVEVANIVHHPKPKKAKKTKERHVPVRIKVEDEPKTSRRPRSPSTESSSSDEAGSVFSALTSNTKITLSERFGKIAQWSVDRSNMENMRITKNSAGGDLKVSIEDGIQSPEDSRPSYSPVRPDGHFPDELMTEGPVDLSWDDVRVRYEYYKNRGYLRGLGLQDYVKWEEWWYQYQEWLRRCEIWERSQINRRRRKKLPVTARLH